MSGEAGELEPVGRFGNTFTAFRHRNYRLWFAGQLVSMLGSWMQTTAQGYLVFELTRSTAYLGYIAFAAGLPSWLFMLYGGVVADRVSRRNLMLVTQSAMMLLAAVLAVLTFTGLVQPPHILCLAFLLGVCNAFDAPARQAFVLEMVDREDMTNAIALNSTMFNTATALGPATGGVIYALFGPAWCFSINAASFIASLVTLALIRPKPRAPVVRGRSVSAELREGLRFTAGDPHVRVLIALVMAASVFGLSFATLMPAWAVRILGGDSVTNGFLQSARGVGSLLGALTIASLGRFAYRGKLLTTACFFFPAVLLVFAWVRILPLSLALLVLVGAGLIVTLNLCNSLVQTLTPDALRGRVMSIYSLSFFGFMPLGGLLAGTLAEHIGEPWTIVVGASVLMLFALGVRLFQPRVYNLE